MKKRPAKPVPRSRKGARAAMPQRPSAKQEAAAALAWLKRHGTRKNRDGMARYGLPSDKALGVPMGQVHQLAKQLGRDHRLAAALWETGVYEARLLCAFVDEPAKVTPAQMERWCRDFDNWAVVDTVCFKLFDQTSHAFAKVEQWHDREGEFQKRAGFVLLACLAGHDETSDDAVFHSYLPLIERGASDPRNFVKKGVSWALRRIGWRSAPLNHAAVALARKLADSNVSSARWVGKDVIRDITRAAVQKRFAKG